MQNLDTTEVIKDSDTLQYGWKLLGSQPWWSTFQGFQAFEERTWLMARQFQRKQLITNDHILKRKIFEWDSWRLGQSDVVRGIKTFISLINRGNAFEKPRNCWYIWSSLHTANEKASSICNDMDCFCADGEQSCQRMAAWSLHDISKC